jgi:hypothetical protein
MAAWLRFLIPFLGWRRQTLDATEAWVFDQEAGTYDCLEFEWLGWGFMFSMRKVLATKEQP